MGHFSSTRTILYSERVNAVWVKRLKYFGGLKVLEVEPVSRPEVIFGY